MASLPLAYVPAIHVFLVVAKTWMPGTSPGLTSSAGALAAERRFIREGLVYAPFSHFFMKLFFAAPASGLPSELTALVAHVSAMHFFMNEVFAAPARALPSLLTALVSQDSCATAEPSANAVIIAAKKIRFIICFSLSQDSHWIGPWNPGAIKRPS
jgi:hypothetical protein